MGGTNRNSCIGVLEGLCSLGMRSHVKDRILVESDTFVYFHVLSIIAGIIRWKSKVSFEKSNGQILEIKSVI